MLLILTAYSLIPGKITPTTDNTGNEVTFTCRSNYKFTNVSVDGHNCEIKGKSFTLKYIDSKIYINGEECKELNSKWFENPDIESYVSSFISYKTNSLVYEMSSRKSTNLSSVQVTAFVQNRLWFVWIVDGISLVGYLVYDFFKHRKLFNSNSHAYSTMEEQEMLKNLKAEREARDAEAAILAHRAGRYGKWNL